MEASRYNGPNSNCLKFDFTKPILCGQPLCKLLKVRCAGHCGLWRGGHWIHRSTAPSCPFHTNTIYIYTLIVQQSSVLGETCAYLSEEHAGHVRMRHANLYSVVIFASVVFQCFSVVFHSFYCLHLPSRQKNVSLPPRYCRCRRLSRKSMKSVTQRFLFGTHVCCLSLLCIACEQIPN